MGKPNMGDYMKSKAIQWWLLLWIFLLHCKSQVTYSTSTFLLIWLGTAVYVAWEQHSSTAGSITQPITCIGSIQCTSSQLTFLRSTYICCSPVYLMVSQEASFHRNFKTKFHIQHSSMHATCPILLFNRTTMG